MVKANGTAKTKAVTYDVAEQLRTPEEMAAYLDAWLKEAPDDIRGIARALGDIARARWPVKADLSDLFKGRR
jgi:DNA-binding phage protein